LLSGKQNPVFLLSGKAMFWNRFFKIAGATFITFIGHCSTEPKRGVGETLRTGKGMFVVSNVPIIANVVERFEAWGPKILIPPWKGWETEDKKQGERRENERERERENERGKWEGERERGREGERERGRRG